MLRLVTKLWGEPMGRIRRSRWTGQCSRIWQPLQIARLSSLARLLVRAAAILTNGGIGKIFPPDDLHVGSAPIGTPCACGTLCSLRDGIGYSKKGTVSWHRLL